MALSTRRRRDSLDIWPGFVDALGALLIVVIFLLMIFTVGQFFLAQLVSGQDDVLDDLRTEIGRLENQLTIERDTNSEIRLANSRLSSDLQKALSDREDLEGRVGQLERQRDAFEGRLAQQLTEADKIKAEAESLREETRNLRDQLRDIRTARDSLANELDTLTLDRERLKTDLAAANRMTLGDKETIETQLIEMERLQRDIQALRTVREDLESRVTVLAAALQTAEETRDALEGNNESLRLENRDLLGALDESELLNLALRRDLTAERDVSKDLANRLSTEQERTALAQVEIDEQQRLADEAALEVALLNAQLADVRENLASLREALDASEALNQEQAAEILTLGDRLNAALASKVQELARYRSEFFGRVREVLEGREEIRVVGDRFILQSEVLFASGSATLQEGGEAQIARLAEILLDISARIPPEVDWLLQVEGHTDNVPIATVAFPSNWELSTARAISVLQFFVDQGLPADRVAAAGYAEFQPIASNSTPAGQRRNRRIELKLTSRDTGDE
ncbi:MAG: peptidoglycan -binding protein [Alphaproteobacteria bacterium]|nr:peptidoglycan -binding protein [Alphaproteobacteria bacterium]